MYMYTYVSVMVTNDTHVSEAINTHVSGRPHLEKYVHKYIPHSLFIRLSNITVEILPIVF